MIANVDEKKYGRLLMQTLPAVISNDDDLERLTNEVDRLMSKGIRQDDLSPEEHILLSLLVHLIEKYEDEHFPMPDSTPDEILRILMKERNVKQKDLMHIFGSSGIASEVVNGKRSISKMHAKKLAEYFNLSVEMFI